MSPARAIAAAAAALLVVLLVVVAAAAAIGVSRAARYRARYEDVVYPRALVSGAYPAMKPGDLILFVASTHGFSNSMATCQFFSHAGVVTRAGGRLCLSEAVSSSRILKGAAPLAATPHARLSPLLARLKHYAGVAYWAPLREPLAPAAEARLARLAAERAPYPSARQLIAGALGVPTASRHCFQHVAWLLDEIGAAPAGAPPLAEAGFYGVAGAVAALPGGGRLKNGSAYAPPRALLYDIDAGGGVTA